MSKLEPCPFCGNEPHFQGDASEWSDDSRYVEMRLVCCMTVSESLGWFRAKSMTPDERADELRNRLTAVWNRRAPLTRDDGMPTSKDERHLRRLLAARVAMPGLYVDDGEASGSEHGIYIDFMRDPVADIDAKLRALNVARSLLSEQALREDQPPIDMILHCPACGMQHIDAREWVDDSDPRNAMAEVMGDTWTNPPHRSHLCHGCGHIWRPADVPTNGVQAIKTKGKNDSGPVIDLDRQFMQELREAVSKSPRYPHHLPMHMGDVLHDVKGWLAAEPEPTEDAERYRYLREQEWWNAQLCVVVNPKDAVKLGHDCPSRERLDALVDAARLIGRTEGSA